MLVSPAPALTSAARGMAAAGRRMDIAANNVANNADDSSPTDLVDDLVDATIVAPFAYTANASVARTAAEMQRALLDIRA
jgi:flagellar hook protein FlgE